MIEVIRPGSVVFINNDIEAKVVTVNIYPDLSVQYQIVWWSGCDRKVEFVHPCEITEQPKVGLKIGFKEYSPVSLNAIPQITKAKLLQIIEECMEQMYDHTTKGELENALAQKKRLESAKQMLTNWETWNKGVT